MDSTFIESVKKQFAYYKHLGDKTFEQLQEPDFFGSLTKKSTALPLL